MSRLPAIELTDVAVRYRVASRASLSAKEHLLRALRSDLNMVEIWGLRGVDLRVDPGEFVGVVGGNGAGKSTLMKAIGGVLPPSRGRVVVRGRMTPVLDLSAGLHLEFSGRENVELLGCLLGRDQREVRRDVDAVLEWAGLLDFADYPVRAYSTGMLTRLAFSVITHDPPRVLLLDEVMAVGDQEFQARSLERINGLIESGAAVVLVTHDLEVIRSRASRTVWLAAGQVAADGATHEVLRTYTQVRRPVPAGDGELRVR